jgi:hypothetical protein
MCYVGEVSVLRMVFRSFFVVAFRRSYVNSLAGRRIEGGLSFGKYSKDTLEEFKRKKLFG